VAAENPTLARELAECPRLVKGYGDTHARGTRNFDTLLAALPRIRTMSDADAQLKRLREAALADDSGEKFGEALASLTAVVPALQPLPRRPA